MSPEAVDGPLIIASILESNLEETLASLRAVAIRLRARRNPGRSTRRSRGPTGGPRGRPSGDRDRARTAAVGRSFDGSVEERRSRLDAALEAGAEFVDVEYDGPLARVRSGPTPAA